MKQITIGISEGTRYFHYENWFKDEPHVHLIRLSYKLDNFNDIEKCDGIVLSGGHDINPRLYNQPDFLMYVDPKDIDERRDEFEWNIIKHTEISQKPLLGICRGLQLVNVYFGGTLVPDIPAFGKFNHSKLHDGLDRMHTVEVDKNSSLYKITGAEKGEVNSAHHQSVDMPGFGLVASALSPDGIIEGLERRNAGGKSFLLLVQWHPERMMDQQSSFSGNIKKCFLDAVVATV
ncbi:MAG TPA: gamma-glutamyl-gamma-aminobutyrate hydrolase family protein [Puia sp.]|nr:gamma-glutamyl-gamma-aminobutyrate hydrolase family protein [Puia sp.]HVZ98512.1 gamma-glutamyl-gamma-aminobutyrate hydrolase family protein [Chitinophagaceae bacterium]